MQSNRKPKQLTSERIKGLEVYYNNPKICLNCNEVIKVNEYSEPHTARIKKFCSRKCAATYNNAERYPNSKQNTCVNCAIKIDPTAKQFCRNCYLEEKNQKRLEHFGNLTKQDALKIYNSRMHHRGAICYHAKLVMRNRDYKCCCCGYSLHVEIAHIQQVMSFSNDTLVKVINDPTNMVYLCRNCHWEFENGYIPFETIKQSIPGGETQFKVVAKKRNKYGEGHAIIAPHINCKKCGVKCFGVKSGYCGVCYQAPKKIKWPPKEELEERLKEISYVALGKELGVTDNAIRKYLSK